MEKPGVQMEERNIGHFFFLAVQFSTFLKSGVQQKLTQHCKAILLEQTKKKKVVISFDTSWDGERRKTRDEPE